MLLGTFVLNVSVQGSIAVLKWLIDIERSPKIGIDVHVVTKFLRHSSHPAKDPA